MTRIPQLLPAFALAALPAALSGALHGTGAEDGSPAVVALKAGTIYLVEDGKVIEGGGTIVVKNGRILAAGADVAVPPGARVVDYGPDAVIVPGLFAADSGYGASSPSARTAEPGLRGIDNFDFYAENATALAAGVTSVYIHPSDSRLLGGRGAVVKLAGADPEHRTLKAPATVHAAVHATARNTPGFWQPPVPATEDVGLGYAKSQLPKTPMGAAVALSELVALARSGAGSEDYGPYAGRELRALLDAGVPWRVTAETEEEMLAVLDFGAESGVPLVLDGATEADRVIDEIAAAGVPVIYNFPWSPNRAGIDRGKGEDARWPSYDVPAKLVAAGVRVAIASGSTTDLLFAAGVASGGRLDPAAALRAITLTPAEIYGVADRVGSIRPGKDADFAVLSGPPIALGTAVLATWVDGELAFDYATAGARGAKLAKGEKPMPASSVSIVVDELHLGDGRVLAPGYVVVRDGKIVSVGEGDATPAGTRIVKGAAAMPGIVDALGHLGLEGSDSVPALDKKLSRILAPGDETDRRVAKAGVTTVVLAPRGAGNAGSPVVAYKPAASDVAGLVLADPAAVRLQWSDNERLNSGTAVKSLLEKVKEYRQKWIEYEEAMSKWTPPPPEAEEEKKADDEKDGEKKDGEAKDEEKKDDDKKADEKKADDKKADADKEKAGDESADTDAKKKKKKKDGEEEVDPDPITGVWQAEVVRPPATEPAKLRMQLKLAASESSDEHGGAVEGNLRCAAVSKDLVDVKGFYDAEQKSLSLKGLGSEGWVALQGTYADDKLKGSLTVGDAALEVEIERTSRDYVVAKRSERRAEKEDKEPAPKGMPKPPRKDEKLEPLRSAMDGKTAVIVTVERADEILECVAAFEAVGIKPVLYGSGAASAGLDARKIAGRVRGVILPHTMRSGMQGTDVRNPYADLEEAGIPLAFHSAAEEGAADVPLMAKYAVANGLSPSGAVRALTSDAAGMLSINGHVGLLAPGKDGDILLLDGPPLAPGTSVVRVWVNGVEVL